MCETGRRKSSFAITHVFFALPNKEMSPEDHTHSVINDWNESVLIQNCCNQSHSYKQNGRSQSDQRQIQTFHKKKISGEAKLKIVVTRIDILKAISAAQDVVDGLIEKIRREAGVTRFFRDFARRLEQFRTSLDTKYWEVAITVYPNADGNKKS